MRVLLAAAAVVCCASAEAQISVSESGTRAHLVDGVTTITLPVTNRFKQALVARIDLKWLDPNDKVDTQASRNVLLNPGESRLEIPLPLKAKSEPLEDRLLYEVAPDFANLTSFSAVKGALSFPNIAGYAFAVRLWSFGAAKPGQPYEVHVLTTHPITGHPVAGVTLASKQFNATTDANGAGTLRLTVDPENSISQYRSLTAKLGDFEQSAEVRDVPLARRQVTIQLDKPLYQPGQTMHIRILSFGADGKAEAGVEHQLKIETRDVDLDHAATLVTSKFGIAASDWEIPANAKSGEYRITVEDGADEFEASREVKIRRYDLPSFKVTAHGVRSYYLPKERATLEVRADYLFGKPLTKGTVKITEGEDPEDDDDAFAQGPIGKNGVFRATFLVDDELPKIMKFRDRHFVAFVTDGTTNRTEQKKFDLRISRERLHIYLAKQEADQNGNRIYVTTFSPDGTPVKAKLEILSGKVVVARGRGNRFGISRLDIGNARGKVKVRASLSNGTRVEQVEKLDENPTDGIWLKTEKVLYRPGETIRGKLSASKARVAAQIAALNREGRVVFSRTLDLVDGTAGFEIPYSPEFGRELAIAAIVGSMRVTTTTVVFPGPEDLKVSVMPEEKTYQPGATARLRFAAATQVALGIAVVDQSVMERAATDSAFGPQRWFGFDQSYERVAEVSYPDLLNMDPAKIDDDFQLLAELLTRWVGRFLIDSLDDDFQSNTKTRCGYAVEKTLEPLRKRLDSLYFETLSYPRDQTSFTKAADPVALDPWLRPYKVQFETQGPDDVAKLCSDGPDKQPNTDDDFCGWEIRRQWFARHKSLISEALRGLEDYPATTSATLRALDDAGIHFASLRDPWHSPLRFTVSADRDRRVLEVRSAGADRKFGTSDDFTVCEFRGTYFTRLGKKIQKAIDSAKQFPTREDQFTRLGVDLAKLRDPWGRRYFVAHHAQETYYDKVSFYSYAEFGRAEETRKQLTPSKHSLLITELKSAGKDGVLGTYDDFSVYRFFRVTDDPALSQEGAQARKPKAQSLAGTGAIVGTITDAAGAVVPNAKITLDNKYVAQTDANGKYMFAGVPWGVYQLKFESPGFQIGIMDRISVEPNNLTKCDFVLQLGSVTETVTVSAAAPLLETSSSSVAASAVSGTAATPRVREYFPETLFWQPELVTDEQGRASLDLKLADTITTWHVAVIASTLDGRVTETETEVRAFQPFQVDLDLPQILTVGDRIALPVPVRNYSSGKETVAVKVDTGTSFILNGAPKQPAAIARDSSSNAQLDLLANAPAEKARLEITAIGGMVSDAIAKSALIHPDGERFEKSVTNILSAAQGSLRIEVPAEAIPGSVKAEVKIYPNVMARLFEAIETSLQTPHGCGEQTISSSYPNLLILKTLKQVGIEDKKLEERARKNLKTGYQRLLGYQSAEGGFKYWQESKPDTALTAYALHFLTDLKAFLPVDEDRMRTAGRWLAGKPSSDRPAHAYSIEALVEAGADDAVLKLLASLGQNAAQFNDPYEMAAFASAAIQAKKPELAASTIRRLAESAQDEQGAAYWALRANTPFHGWGRSGQVETTGMVVSALAKWRGLAIAGEDLPLDSLISRGVLFLLKNSGRSGIWGSGQATMRALTALLETVGKIDTAERSVDVIVNGTLAGTVGLPSGRVIAGPSIIDVSRLLRSGVNEISLRGTDGRMAETQFNAEWYENWSKPHPARDFVLETKFSSNLARVNQAVTCSVTISRPKFRGYGMVIADVGLPPGVEVDRGSLEEAIGKIDSYEVAPDHVTFYVWPQAKHVKFDFQFRARFGMKAKMAKSVLYDYYNPDERAVLVPGLFTAR